MSQKDSFSAMLPLFLVLLIDGMGLGLLFPIMNTLLVDPHSGFFSAGLSEGWRDFYYGLTIGIFMICWFFGAAILGELSDHVGRKKCLMICLLGSFIGYFLSALAIVIGNFAVLILGRVIAGFTAGSQPIAQAAIVDISSEEHKARNIGLILLAVSLGFVLGPLCSGILSDPSLVSWFSFTTPMYFASILSLFNAFLLYYIFHETFEHVDKKAKLNIKLLHAVDLFISAFKHQAIKKYSLVLLVMIFGWSNYFSFISLYLTQVHHYTTMQTSLFLAVMGLGFSLGCGVLVDMCTKKFDMNWVVVAGLLVTALAILITLLAVSPTLDWFMVFVIGASLSVAYSTLLAIFSNLVSNDEQGWVMGVTGSIMAICFGLTSLFTGVMAQIGAGIPLILSIIGLTSSAILLSVFTVKKKYDGVGANEK